MSTFTKKIVAAIPPNTLEAALDWQPLEQVSRNPFLPTEAVRKHVANLFLQCKKEIPSASPERARAILICRSILPPDQLLNTGGHILRGLSRQHGGLTIRFNDRYDHALRRQHTVLTPDVLLALPPPGNGSPFAWSIVSF